MRTKILALALVPALGSAHAAQDSPATSSLASPSAVGNLAGAPVAVGLGAALPAAGESERPPVAAVVDNVEPNSTVSSAIAPPDEQPSKAGRLFRAGEELIMHALNLVGVRYRYGGANPDSGLDCSGLVQHVFKEAIGMALPHNAYSISLQGRRVQQSELQPGDLVFFNTLKRAFSHVGIYIGGNRFVHAGRTNQQIEVAEFDNYWVKRFDGGRRLIDHSDDNK